MEGAGAWRRYGSHRVSGLLRGLISLSNSILFTTPLTNADSLIRSSCVTRLRQVLALRPESHPSCSPRQGDTREGTSGGKTDGMKEEGGREWMEREREQQKKVKERVQGVCIRR